MSNSLTESSDIDIIHQILSGNVNVFEILIDRYRTHVFSIVRKHIPGEMVDEVAHDVFVRAYKGLSGFSKKSGFKQWLSGISTRTCYDFWRKKYRVKEIPMSRLTDTQREWIEHTMSSDAVFVSDNDHPRSKAAEVLEWALNKLPAADRMILELVHLEGYSHKEASVLLGWSVTNVKVRSWRARKKLHAVIMKEKTQVKPWHHQIVT